MIAGRMLQDAVGSVVLALTPVERWSAARRLNDGGTLRSVSEHGFYVAAGLALVVLLWLLWWVSRKRQPVVHEMNRELFSENAMRRGLSSRERQILLAIVMRSGLGQSHDIFTTVDAFDRGATKLLAECVRTRTPEEIERLKTEVTFLREKLGFQALRAPGGLAGTRRPSSRDIPVGKAVEVTRRRHRAGATIRAEVVRNDDIELAVELETPVDSRPGDFWRARYTYGMSVWEFDTTAVSCEKTRLVLNHVDNVRFVNRRRFPRVAVTVPALVAVFPFMRRASSETRRPEMRESDMVGAPAFVHATVTELAGPGLRVEAALRVRAGDRVVVVFKPTGMGVSKGDREYLIEDVGRVRHCREIENGVSFAVELTGLSEAEIDELVRITNVMSSQANNRPMGAEPGAIAVVDNGAVVQEV